MKGVLCFVSVALFGVTISYKLDNIPWKWTREAAEGKWHEIGDTVIPESFDAREQWPHCPSISVIHNVGTCSACWAVAATSVMADRICIKSNGTINKNISAQYLLGCTQMSGCHGGFPLEAFNYWHFFGIPTGGNYNTTDGCQTYKLPPCSHYNTDPTLPHCEDEDSEKPECVQECDTGSGLNIDKEMTYGEEGYYVPFNEVQIQLEILKNGTATAGMYLHTDFFNYTSGVYIMNKDAKVDDSNHYILNGHAVKLLGWGVENGTKYWLAANSWGKSWGDQGTFKILRGKNHCNIENQVIAGMPNITIT